MKDSNSELKKIIPLAEGIKKEEDALMSSFANDPLLAKKLRDLHLSKADVRANLGLISAFQEDLHYCAKCPGTAQCEKEPPLHTSELLLSEGRLERTLGPCAPYLQEQIVLSSYLYRDYPLEWLSVSPTSLSNSQRVKEVFLALAKAVKSPVHPWVYLTGPVGSGRSYLAAAFSNGYALQGKRLAYMNANSRFDELKGLAVKNKPLFDRTMAELESLSLLVIDDFGSEYRSDYVRDQVVMPLLNERAKKGLMTIFTSDYSLAEIKELYSQNRASTLLASKLTSLIESKIDGPTIVERGCDGL